MSEIITISNSLIKAKISTRGAELVSLAKNNDENIWSGPSENWNGSSPILFPICGTLKDNTYIYDGKKYELLRHGFARRSEFILEMREENRATFLLASNVETLRKYPFEFEFRVRFTLNDNMLKVDYIVTNTDNKAMYFSVGSHEGYRCPKGIEEYSILFDNIEDLENNLLTGVLLNYSKESFGKTNELKLKYDYFVKDSLIFTNLKSKNVILKNEKTNKKIKIEFEDFDNLVIWALDNEKFVCVEAWCGLPDYVDSDYDITKKPGIIKLMPQKTVIKSHSITL